MWAGLGCRGFCGPGSSLEKEGASPAAFGSRGNTVTPRLALALACTTPHPPPSGRGREVLGGGRVTEGDRSRGPA